MKAIYKTDEEYSKLIYVSDDGHFVNMFVDKINKVLSRHKRDFESIKKQKEHIPEYIFRAIERHNLCKYCLVVEDVEKIP
jgi:hypothetical protein